MGSDGVLQRHDAAPLGGVASRIDLEPGTVVESGWIWAGRPARRFRQIKAGEREAFARFRDIYIGYSSAYRGLA